jgi:hypothetical protein
MLSERLAIAVGSMPPGTGTSIASANGTRTASLMKPPQFLPIGSPYIDMRSTRSQLPVWPRRQVVHSPQDTWNGTLTRSPGRALSTASPTSSTSATPSCPNGNGPSAGARPRTKILSRSHVATASGRTIASPSPSSRGSAASSHSSRPGSMKFSCRMGGQC